MNMEIYDEICSPALPQTGRGVSIAVIELPARRDHPLFASNIKSFVPSPRSSIHPVSPQYHPTTTLACMVGHYEGYHRIGLAPDADVHLYETNFFKPEFFNGQETSEEQREGKSEIKALLREEILHQLRNVKKDLMENKRFDAVVFFAAVKMDPPKNMLLPLRTLRVRNSIIEITDDIEAQTNTAVFEPTDAEGFLGTNECGKTYRKDEFGVDLWDVDVPEGLVGIPINKRYVASMRDDSIFRETRYMGHCLVAAVLVGGFALCRQVSPNLRKKDYYDLLRQTARVLDYGNDVRTRTVCFRSAVKALSL